MWSEHTSQASMPTPEISKRPGPRRTPYGALAQLNLKLYEQQYQFHMLMSGPYQCSWGGKGYITKAFTFLSAQV